MIVDGAEKENAVRHRKESPDSVYYHTSYFTPSSCLFCLPDAVL